MPASGARGAMPRKSPESSSPAHSIRRPVMSQRTLSRRHSAMVCACIAAVLFGVGTARAQSTGQDACHISPQRTIDSLAAGHYATLALCELVSQLSRTSRDIPASLNSYRVGMQSEIAFIVRTAASAQGAGAATAGSDAGRERLLHVEQVGSLLSWNRRGDVEQHVLGFRAHSITTTVSALTVLRRPWVVPVLYGNRLHVLLAQGASAVGEGDVTDDTTTGVASMAAVHPFADDRDRVYRFDGGDTVAVLHLGSRAVTVVRIHIEPVSNPVRRTLLFRGVIDVDAERHQVIRMRGQFLTAGRRRNVLRRALNSAWETVVFAELENGEFDGQYWLPTRQRIDAQIRSSLAGEFRPLLRLVSRFRQYQINDATGSAEALSSTGQSTAPTALLTFAPRDSLSAYAEWPSALGDATTTAARESDFDDVAPDSWRPTGAPRVDWRSERINDVFRFNRVEGPFTGVAATVRFRDRALGLSVGAHIGWAWAEETARGAVSVRLLRGPWSYSVRGERSLINTNDFRPLLDYEQSLMALLVTADDYDYLDRRSLFFGATRVVPLPGSPTVHIEAGPGADHAEYARVRYGLIHLDSAFRANRAVTSGRYLRTAIAIDLHPNVTGDFLTPGIGGGVWYERGDGALRWQRIEARIAARREVRAVTLAGRVDAIAVFTRQVLPQQLIEFGETEGLPGYAYKEFGGDRALLARGAIEYQLPWLRAPIRTGFGTGRFAHLVLPGIAPSLAFGGQAGWATARDSSTRAALALFGTRRDSISGRLVPATRPTDGVRSTVSATLRLFSGTLGLGVARPVDLRGSARAWRFVFGVGQPF